MEKNRVYKCLGGRVFCKACRITISKPRHTKYPRPDIGILCDYCANIDSRADLRKKLLEHFSVSERAMIRKLALTEYTLFE